MPKGLDKIEGDFKKLQPKLKPLTKEAALKQLKVIATTLDKCWDQEDALQEGWHTWETNYPAGHRLDWRATGLSCCTATARLE